MSQPAPRTALEGVVEQVGRQLPGAKLDGWTPPVQGAVGHVAGLRSGTGDPLVLKVFGSDERRRTEVAALRTAAEVAGAVVPQVVASSLADAAPGGWLVMTRRPGTRWADLRDGMSRATTATVVTRVARVMRALHSVPGPGFGPLLAPAAELRAWPHVARWAAEVVATFGRADGPAELVAAVERMVQASEPAVAACPGPVFCHRDVNGGNLLVDPATHEVTGVVDFERAAWDDGLVDLATTAVHVDQHAPGSDAVLLDAYGVRDADALQRVRLHRALLLAEEWAWVTGDRPPGWPDALTGIARRLGRLVDTA